MWAMFVRVAQGWHTMRRSRSSVFCLTYNAVLLRTSVKLWAVDLYLMLLEEMLVCLSRFSISSVLLETKIQLYEVCQRGIMYKDAWRELYSRVWWKTFIRTKYWRRQVPLKRRYTLSRLCDVTA